MAVKTQRKMTEEVHQGMFGVDGTEDRGLVGDFKDLVKLFREQNGRVRKNTIKISIITGVLAGAGLLGGLEIGDVIHLFGG